MNQVAGRGAGAVRTFTFSTLAAVSLAAAAHGGVIDPALEKVLRNTPPDEVVSTLVYLGPQVDLPGLSAALDAQRVRMRERHEAVVLELRDTALATQAALITDLENRRAAGAVRDFTAFWIANVVRVDAAADEIRRLAGRADVDHVFLNHPIEGIRPVIELPADGGEGAGGVASVPEPGLNAIRAPEVWALGIDGTGTLVSTLDTGVAGNHPSLASRWRGLDPAYLGNPGWAFFDPVTNWQFPQDSGDHGTHTMGTVCGGAPGDQIGVAPGAEWIHAAVIDRVSIAQTVADAMLAFQWAVDPDENAGTDFDVPDVCSNSWGLADVHGYPDCDQLFWSFLDACEAAGVVMVFAAGNEGFSGLRRPSDRATDAYRTFAVAALNGNSPPGYPIASFSSRGPTFCTPGGGAAIKPDIASPGVDVRSAVPSGYGTKSGTSMATPHMCGVVALLRQANPELAVEQIKQIIYDTAQDLGAPGEDNDYGAGLVDAFDAVQMALSTVSLSFAFPEGLPELIDPVGGVTTIPLAVSGQNAQPVPGSARLHYRTDKGGPFAELLMSETGPDQYEASFPDSPCGALVEYYFSVEADSGDTVTSPFSAPDSLYDANAYSALVVAFSEDFEQQNGWTVQNGPGLTAGAWQQGVPAGGGDRGDPAADADESGQCFLTANVDGDSDVDSGSTTLTSPALDATVLPDPHIAYWRWYHNTFGNAPMQDTFVVQVSSNDGQSWVGLETVGPGGPEVSGGWIRKSFRIADFVAVTNQFRIRFTASDVDPQSVVEAAIDGIEISQLVCDEPRPTCPGDTNDDAEVDVQDLVEIIVKWGPCPVCAADVTGDGVVDVQDLTAVIVAWGPCPR